MTKYSKGTRLLSLVLSLMMVLSLFSVTAVTASADGETYTISLSPKAEELGVSRYPEGDPAVGTGYEVLFQNSYSGELIIANADDPTVLVPITYSWGLIDKYFAMPSYNVKIWTSEEYYKEFYDYTPSAEDPSMHIKTSKSDPEDSETENHTFGSDSKCIYCGAAAVSHSLEWTEAAESSRQEIYCATTGASLESFDTLCEDFYYYIAPNNTFYITKADDPTVIVTKNPYNGFTAPNYDMKVWTKEEYDAIDLRNAKITLSSNVCYRDGTPLTPAAEVAIGENVLTQGTDYIATYTDNVDAGRATVTITPAEGSAYINSAKANFSVVEPGETDITVVNNNYPFMIDSNSSAITISPAAEGFDITSAVWYVSDSELGTYTELDVTGATIDAFGVLTFAPTNNYWYKCIVTDGLGDEHESEAVQLVNTFSRWYITNSQIGYAWYTYNNARCFHVIGKSKGNWIPTSYNSSNSGWEINTSSLAQPEPTEAKYYNTTSNLDYIRGSFDPEDYSAVNFAAKLGNDQRSLSFGCDIYLAGNDGAPLTAVRKKGVVKQIQIVDDYVNGNHVGLTDAIPLTNAAMVLRFDKTPDRFWLGNYSSRKAYDYNTTSNGDIVYSCAYVIDESIPGNLKCNDSGMTISWFDLEPGQEVGFSYAVGDVQTTGASLSAVIEPDTRELVLNETEANILYAIYNEDGTTQPDGYTVFKRTYDDDGSPIDEQLTPNENGYVNADEDGVDIVFKNLTPNTRYKIKMLDKAHQEATPQEQGVQTKIDPVNPGAESGGTVTVAEVDVETHKITVSNLSGDNYSGYSFALKKGGRVATDWLMPNAEGVVEFTELTQDTEYKLVGKTDDNNTSAEVAYRTKGDLDEPCITKKAKNILGNASNLRITVRNTDAARTLVEGEDYEVEPPAAWQLGSNTVTLKGINNYAGSQTTVNVIMDMALDFTNVYDCGFMPTIAYTDDEDNAVTETIAINKKSLAISPDTDYTITSLCTLNFGILNSCVSAPTETTDGYVYTLRFTEQDMTENTAYVTHAHNPVYSVSADGTKLSALCQDEKDGENKLLAELIVPADPIAYRSDYNVEVKTYSVTGYTISSTTITYKNNDTETTTTTKPTAIGSYTVDAAVTVNGVESHLTGSAEIIETQHEWGTPTYEWTQEGNIWKCTATRVCDLNDTHIDAETVTATSAVKTPAECEEMGVTTYTATFEKSAFETQTKDVTDIDALNHIYGEPTYEWDFADGKWTCTAARVCGRDGTHIETETVTAASKVKTSAKCEEMGVTTYTATFEKSAFETQTKDVTDIDALNHIYGEPTYEWDFADGKWTCTAARVCGRDGTHIETETVTAASEVKTSAKCEEMGVTTYTATFENSAFETQTKDVTDIDALDHAWNEPTYEWNYADGKWTCTATRTCGRDGTHIETETVTATSTVKTPAECEKMGVTTYTATFTNTAFSQQTKDETDIDALDHTYGEPTYVWNYADGKWTCTATRVCGRDGTHIETETVTATSKVDKAAACEEKGDTTYTATFVNPAFAAQTKTVTDIEELGHKFINFWKWVWDGFNHAVAWLFCDNNPDHVQTIDVPSAVDTVDEPTCTEDGYNYYVATIDVAGKIYTTVNVETVDQLGHKWGEPTYTWNDDNSECTAERTCTRDTSHKETETVNTTYEVITPATCEEDGLGRYTAAFENEVFKAQTKDITLEKLGHEWANPVWNWTSDTKASLTLTCEHDKTHTKTVDAAVGVVVTEEPTEEKEGVRTYTAKVTVDGVEYTTTRTETIPKIEPAPVVPTPGVPTPDVPTPYEPTPDVPTPGEPTPDVPTPDEPTPDVPTPDEPIPVVPTPDEPTPETKDEPTPETKDEPEPEKKISGILGDVNNDGVVDSADALMILRNSVGLETFDETQNFLGDVNEDGENIDSADALAVLRYSVGMIDIEKIGTPVSKTVA